MIDEYHKNRNRWTSCGPKQTNKKQKRKRNDKLVSPIPENKVLNEATKCQKYISQSFLRLKNEEHDKRNKDSHKS
jgi:hypothetical protein